MEIDPETGVVKLKLRDPEAQVDYWRKLWLEWRADAFKRRESMSWACDKLAKLEAEVALTRKRLEYHESTLRDVRHAISGDNPKLAKAKGE